MAKSGQRVWSRVEAPGTLRGHALVASFGGERWTAWENADGRWSLRYGDGDPVITDDWTAARGLAEKLRDRAPPQHNPINPHVANAAAAGTAFAMRAQVLPNPMRTAAGRQSQVCAAVPASWLARGCSLLPSGVTRVTVHRGMKRAAVQAVSAANFPFDVEVVEE